MDIDFDFEKIKDEIEFRVYEAHDKIIAVINFAAKHSDAPDRAKIAGDLLYTYCDKMLDVLTMPAKDFRAKFDI